LAVLIIRDLYIKRMKESTNDNYFRWSTNPMAFARNSKTKLAAFFEKNQEEIPMMAILCVTDVFDTLDRFYMLTVTV
jgi:hypothetical protein